LEDLRNIRKTKLKDTYDKSMGTANQKADYELLDKVAEGDLKDAAMCMSAAEDIQVL